MNLIRKLIFRITPSCEEATTRQWEALESGTISFRKRIGLKMHQWACAACRAYGKDLNWVVTILGKIPDARDFGVNYKLGPKAKARLTKCVKEILGKKK